MKNKFLFIEQFGMIRFKFWILLLMTSFFGCNSNQLPTTEIRNQLKKFYKPFGVDGSFLLYDPQENKYIVCNPELANQSYVPASTFKICNALIGLETKVIEDEKFIIPWDGVTRNPYWDKNHSLTTAFEYSVVWYFQELARRVGGKRMKYWLDLTNYGNADTTGGIDQFWLNGGLRISAYGQIEFLKKLYENHLPFSQRSMDIVKKIMLVKDTTEYLVRGKTGWGTQDHMEIGWFVGWLEKKGKVYYFSNMVQMSESDSNYINFDQSRTAVVYRILHELQLTDQKQGKAITTRMTRYFPDTGTSSTL